jgi:hypothetical protein
MDPTTPGRYGKCGHFRPQPDDDHGLLTLLGYPRASAQSSTTTPTEGVEVDYATEYTSLSQLSQDAGAVAVVKPTGATSLVQTPDGHYDTLAGVELVQTVSGGQLPSAFNVHEIGASNVANSVLMTAGKTYLVYLRPGIPSVAGQYDLVGGSQALFVNTKSGTPASTDASFVPVDPEVAPQLPARVSIAQAQASR